MCTDRRTIGLVVPAVLALAACSASPADGDTGVDAGRDATGEGAADRPDTTTMAESGTGDGGGRDGGTDDTTLPAPGALLPGIPTIDAAMKARLRTVFLSGQMLGNRADVFCKVGDSITASDSFLKPLGCGEEVLDTYASLAPLVAAYRGVMLPSGWASYGGCEESNPFTVDSQAASEGWAAIDALTPLPMPPAGCSGATVDALPCELSRLHPSVCLVMYGTNDLERFNDPTGTYHDNLDAVVATLLGAGVIPVLSTIPPRLDSADLGARVAPHNAVVADIARARQVPLWDYHLAMVRPSMVHQGIGSDGVHPNLYGGCQPAMGCWAANFTAEGLRYGYNVRNLGALQVLAKIRAIVLEDGAPES